MDLSRLTFEELQEFDYSTLTQDELLRECLRQIQDYSDRCLTEYAQQQEGPQGAVFVSRSLETKNHQTPQSPSGDASGALCSLLLAEPKTSRLQ